MRTHRPATQPLRVAVLCSHRAPALRYLVDHHAPRGALYEIVCCISSEAACADEDAIRACGIPIHLHPIRLFCEQHGTLWTNRGAPSSYDIVTAQLLWPYGVDIVVLDTYLYVLSDVMLALYQSRV